MNQFIREEQDRAFQEIQRQKVQLAAEIPEEPEVGEADCVRVLVKLPGGQRLERRFRQSHSLKLLYFYVFCHPESPDNFDITTNFPRTVLRCRPEQDPPTFEEAGLGRSVMLFVNDLDA